MTTNKRLNVVAAVALIAIAAFTLSSNAQRNDSPTGKPLLEGKVRQAIQRNSLTRIKSECLILNPEEDGTGFYIFEVREAHNAACGGDVETAPLLFTVRTDPEGREMWSDAASDDGELTPLQP